MITDGARSTVPPRGDASDDSALVSVEKVKVGYTTSSGYVAAIEDVTFQVKEREKVLLLGPSGCGKSTLLKAIAGFLPITAGSIRVKGRTNLEPGPDRAVVFQEFDQLFPWKTVLNNVTYPLRVSGRSKTEAREAAVFYLSMMGLASSQDRYPHELSGGMKQRVAIARALALEPTVLLMDEPFGALDAQTRSRLQQELNSIAARTEVTILFVTHSIDEAIYLGDRVVVLGPPPSRVREVVDVVGVDDSAAESFIVARQHLRKLLSTPSGEELSHAVYD